MNTVNQYQYKLNTQISTKIKRILDELSPNFKQSSMLTK